MRSSMDSKTSTQRRYPERKTGDNVSRPRFILVHEIHASTYGAFLEDPGIDQDQIS